MIAKKEGMSQDERMLLAASFFYLASTMMVNPLIAGFTGTFGASASFVGLVGGLMGFCSLFIRPVAGNLADLFTKRRLATAGAIVMSVSTLLYGVAQSAWQVAALRLMSGAGYSFCSVCMASWFASLLPRDRMGSGMGMFGMMNALGMAVGPAVGFQVYQAFGYRAALVLAGALAALTAILVQFVQNPGRAVPGVRVRDKAKSLVAPDAVPAAVIVGLFTVPYMVTQSFLASYVEDLQINVRVGLFFPVYALVLLALRYGLKRAFDSWRFRTFLIGSSICATAAFCLLSIMSGDIAMFAAAACMAGGYGVMCSVCQGAAVRVVGPDGTGMANSTYYMGIDIGMALGPTLGGWLYGAFGPSMLFWPCLVFAPCALLVYAASRVLHSL